MRTLSSSLILFLLCFAAMPAFSQQPSAYTFQQDDTVLREKYYEATIDKEKTLLKNIGKENASDYKRVYRDQFAVIKKFWNSDRPVTEPAAHGYLDSIVQKIITTNPELKALDARIVFSRDWWPNAFSMGDGTIILNAGLFIYLGSEAELVFAISHEIAHYYLQHTPTAIKNYIETINSAAYQEELKRIAKTQYGANKKAEELMRTVAFDNRRHSRDKEAEADRKALEYMKNSGYDCAAVTSCLRMLDRIDDTSYYAKPLVIDQFFNYPSYAFRKKWIQKESAIFSQLDEKDGPLTAKEKDSLKTHPDCESRIALLATMLEQNKGQGKTFIVSEQTFNRLKVDFYLEMMEECYRQDDLSRNLYFSVLLLENEPGHPTAVYSIARCLNKVYDYQKNHKLGKSIDTESKSFPEEYNLLLRMLGRLRLEEILALNMNFCKKYYAAMEGHAGFKEETEKLKNFNKQP